MREVEKDIVDLKSNEPNQFNIIKFIQFSHNIRIQILFKFYRL